MRDLRFGRKGAASPSALVVFLHGYGADGADLLGLADVLAPHLPEVGFLDARLAQEGLTPDRLLLLGFSQGAMMSLHVAFRRAEPVAGVVAISGRLLRPDALPVEARVKPPVLLIHGDQDPVVPFADMARAGDALVAAGVPTYGHVMQGTGHGIAPDGLGAALQFIKERLG